MLFRSFFLDEATAFAAGHRPCFECRRADAVRYAEIWAQTRGQVGRASAPAMDERLHLERIDPRGAKLSFAAQLADLPDGAMVRHKSGAALLWGGRLYPWSFAGYGTPEVLAASTTAEVLTPHATVAILTAGYRPQVHPSAGVS